MTEGITSALVAAFVLGLWFPTTRGMSIAAAAILTFIYPSLLAAILGGAAALAYVRFWHRR